MSELVDQVASTAGGRWRVWARPPGGARREVTYVRGLPVVIDTMSESDPFGWESANIGLPMVWVFDHVGVGDLDWLVAGADVDIVWEGALPAGYPYSGFAWEGYLTSFEYSNSLTVSLVGAMRQLDNYLAKPEFPGRPIPYEWAIKHSFSGKPDLRLASLDIEWPTWWTTRYQAPDKRTPQFLTPIGVVPGERWTGLVTRSTGTWDATLTSYLQTLLASMYTDRGRWTIDLDRNRKPVLRHRDYQLAPSAAVVTVDLVDPGVSTTLSVDHSQSLNVVYGQAKSRQGDAYTGMQVSADGLSTTYLPLAALRQVQPVEDTNGWLETQRMRKEVMIEVQPGLTTSQAKTVGNAHLQRFADPGVTGTVTLVSDPRLGGEFMPRHLMRAGMTIQLRGLFGSSEGMLLHVSQVSHSLSAGSVSLTVDSKYRDQLTVSEVRERGRDAMAINRSLIGGQYQLPVPDQLLPWNYAEGSGYIPSGPSYSSNRMFEGMPADITFPWEEWTTQRPPGDPAWTNSYIEIGPSVDPRQGELGLHAGRTGPPRLPDPHVPGRQDPADPGGGVRQVRQRDGRSLPHLALLEPQDQPLGDAADTGRGEELAAPPALQGIRALSVLQEAWENYKPTARSPSGRSRRRALVPT